MWDLFKRKKGMKKAEDSNLAIGVTSFLNKARDEHIVILDYDDVTLNKVLIDVKQLIEVWKLGHAEIYGSNRGYHVFFWWDCVPFTKLQLIAYSSFCDKRFKDAGYGYKTIRVAGKYKKPDVTFIKTVKSKYYQSNNKVMGDLKRQEHGKFQELHRILNKARLKENTNNR